MNGLKCKQTSTKDIIEKLAPKVIAFCETKLPSDQFIKKMLPGYDINSRPTKLGQSGLVIAVKKQTFNSVLDVTTTSHNNILVTRIGLDSIAVRIILGYAPQETDSVDLREQFFTELEIEIGYCSVSGEFPIILGDMNAKIAMEDEVIKGVSPNGKLLLEIIADQNLKVLNFDEKCQGKLTHVIRTTGSSSVLDYAMTTNEIAKHVRDVLIDEECMFCPFGIKKEKGIIIPQYSDHNAIVTTLEIPYTKKKIIDNNLSWKITAEGLDTFHSLTSEENFPTEVVGKTSQEKYNNYERLLFGTMGKCFMQRRKKKERKTSPKFLPLYRKVMVFSKGGKAQRKVARTYIQAIKAANLENASTKNMENI